MSALRAHASSAGPLAAAVFALAYAALTLAPVPKNALSISAGLLFGFWFGLIVVWTGAMTGALLAFALARTLGRGSRQVPAGRQARLQQVVRRHGLLGVVALRLVPVMPFTVMNYGSGLTGLRAREYTLGTAVGIVPGTAFYVGVGAYGSRPGWALLVTGTVLVVLAAGLAAIWNSRRRQAE